MTDAVSANDDHPFSNQYVLPTMSDPDATKEELAKLLTNNQAMVLGPESMVVHMASPSYALAEFNKVFEIEENTTGIPAIPDLKVVELRKNLLTEEFKEYMEAVFADDIVELADALADMVYIIYGTARVYGIPLDEVFAEVHRTNMAKAPGGIVKRREDGKVLKPDGWQRPDIAGILSAAASRVTADENIKVTYEPAQENS